MSTSGTAGSGEEEDRTVSDPGTASSVDSAGGAAHTDTPNQSQPDLKDVPNINVDELRTLDNNFLDENQNGKCEE